MITSRRYCPSNLVVTTPILLAPKQDYAQPHIVFWPWSRGCRHRLDDAALHVDAYVGLLVVGCQDYLKPNRSKHLIKRTHKLLLTNTTFLWC
jgi:hypothetical protein